MTGNDQSLNARYILKLSELFKGQNCFFVLFFVKKKKKKNSSWIEMINCRVCLL